MGRREWGDLMKWESWSDEMGESGSVRVRWERERQRVSSLKEKGEREVRWRKKRDERKKYKIIICTATVTVHIRTVTVAMVHKRTILHAMMWVFFWAKLYKRSTFFYFAKLFTIWCGCSKALYSGKNVSMLFGHIWSFVRFRGNYGNFKGF